MIGSPTWCGRHQQEWVRMWHQAAACLQAVPGWRAAARVGVGIAPPELAGTVVCLLTPALVVNVFLCVRCTSMPIEGFGSVSYCQDHLAGWPATLTAEALKVWAARAGGQQAVLSNRWYVKQANSKGLAHFWFMPLLRQSASTCS